MKSSVLTAPMIGFHMVLLATLPGCGGGGGGGGPSTGVLNLSVTDSPVDKANNVLVEFTGVELKPVAGEWTAYDLSGDSLTCQGWLDGDAPAAPAPGEPTVRCIDLLALNGGASEIILDGVVVPAGDYESIRLQVNAERGVQDSIFVDTGNLRYSLFIPSGAQTGLKLNSSFNIGLAGENDFVIEFDLRKSVNNPQGFDDYRLKPSLKLIENSRTGVVFGRVNPDFIIDDACMNGDQYDMGNAVYVYSGDVEPIDYRGEASDPFVSATVTQDSSGDFTYRVAFLPEGSYTLAFTCQGSLDDPEVADELQYYPAPPETTVINVTAGSEQQVDFL